MVRELLCNFKDYMSTWFYNKDTVDNKLAEKSDVTHIHDNATVDISGFMSNSDKSKLDGIADNATNISIDDVMNYIDTTCTFSLNENGELIFTDE